MPCSRKGELMLYQFEAMDATGQEIKDKIEADSQEEAMSKVRQMGYFVTKIAHAKPINRDKEVRKLRKKYRGLLHPSPIRAWLVSFGPIVLAFIVGILFGIMLGRL